MTPGRLARVAVACAVAVAVVGSVLAALMWLAGRGGSDDRPPRVTPLELQLPLNPAELDAAGVRHALDLAQQAGVGQIRAGAIWWFVAQRGSPDDYDWSSLDRLVDAASARGMQVSLQLSGTPDAVHPEVVAAVRDAGERVWYPPRTPAQVQRWGRFVYDTVTHFKGRVDDFEIWNEPNVDTFWRPEPSPAEYARLLAESYARAKQAWPRARVVFGGLSHNDVGYLQHYYTEARRLGPHAAEQHYFFDVLDVHPYTDGRSPDETSPDLVVDGTFGTVDKNFSGLRRVKDVMDINERTLGTAGKAIVLGEFGFSTAPTGTAPAVPDYRRAYFLRRAVASAASMPFVTALCWYGFLPDSATPENWTIITAAGTTWTYQARADVAGVTDVTDVTAGQGPMVRLPDPSRLRPDGSPIRPVLEGPAAGTVLRTEFYVDGVLQAEGAGPEVRWTPRHDTLAAGQAQIVIYTRDRHAWPSAVVTIGRE